MMDRYCFEMTKEGIFVIYIYYNVLRNNNPRLNNNPSLFKTKFSQYLYGLTFLYHNFKRELSKRLILRTPKSK